MDACIFARRFGDTWSLIPIRSRLDAEVYLGALCDQSGLARARIEIWVQRPPADQAQPGVGPPTNATIDDLWQARFNAWRKAAPDLHVLTGLEDGGTPLVLDPAIRSSSVLTNESGAALALCTDDRALRTAGLPTYASSAHRYLRAGAGPDATYYPSSPSAPVGPTTTPLAKLAGLPFNLAGGRLAFTFRDEHELTEVIDALTAQDPTRLLTGTGGGASADESRAEGMYFTRHGASERLAETLYLKLSLLLQCAESVQRLMGSGGRPHLDLGPDRFRVSMAQGHGALPRYWTARARLCAPSVAAPVSLSGSESAVWVRAAPEEVSAYLPDRRSSEGVVRADVRIERVDQLGDESSKGRRFSLVGVLDTDADLSVVRDNVLCFLLALPVGSLLVYATLDASSGGGRFRSFPIEAAPELASTCATLGGVVFPDTHIRLIRTSGPAIDLYALGVIGVRTLLVNESHPIGPTLEAILALGRTIGATRPADEPLAASIAATLDTGGPGVDLGAARLVDAPIDATDAEAATPRRLWAAVLGAIIPLFPGLGPFSLCRSLGDTPRDRPERMLDRPVAELRRLTEQARSLVVTHQRENHELRSVVESMLESCRGGDAPS